MTNMKNIMKEMRTESFEKLKTDKGKFNSDDIFKIVEIIRDYRSTQKIASESDFSKVVEQIRKDAILYKKYDALCMWLDDEDGLALYYPELIKKIATDIGGLGLKAI